MTVDRDTPDGEDEQAAQAPPHPLVALEQRQHLSRILRAFLVVVVLLPFAGLGGAWAWLLLPLVVVAALAFREAVRLRRSVRRHGNASVSRDERP